MLRRQEAGEGVREGGREGSITDLVPDFAHHEIAADLEPGSLFFLLTKA